MGLDTRFRAFWFGTAASIPTGWSRDTDYDEYYLTGDDEDATASGGTATHQHDVPNHSHGGNTHTHDVNGQAATPGMVYTHTTAGSPTAWTQPSVSHTHGTVASNSAATAWSTVSGLTTDAVAAHPPYAKAIIIKPDDDTQLIPQNAVVLYNGAAVPSNCRECDGESGTHDLADKYIRGADAAGDGDAVSSLGSPYHTHTSSHSHTEVVHGHYEKDAAASSATVLAGLPGIAGLLTILQSVHHGVELAVNAGTSTDSVSVDLDTRGHLPVYTRLLGLQQMSPTDTLAHGMVLVWTGEAADLPDDWALCDGTNGTIDTVDKQIYVTADLGEIGDESGVNTHKHQGGTHTHTPSSATHTHTPTVTTTLKKRNTTGATTNVAGGLHSHTWPVSTEATTVTPTDQGDVDTVDHRLPWKGVVFAEYQPKPSVHIQGGRIQGGHIAAA